MSLERVINTLVNLGLSRTDAEVYVYLGKKGPQKVEDLIKSLNYSKNQINSSLKNLVTKELVKKEGSVFNSLPFEEALELLIKKEKEQADSVEKSKKEFLVSWKKES
ncbi:MAG: helix-turn-helix domain-containing protein [Candidatus Bathyarchaeota archaeon]